MTFHPVHPATPILCVGETPRSPGFYHRIDCTKPWFEAWGKTKWGDMQRLSYIDDATKPEVIKAWFVAYGPDVH